MLLSGVLFRHKCGMESIVSQFQKETDVILCVVNGYYFVSYDTLKDLPNSLRSEDKYNDKEANTVEYRYRCKNTGNLYTFFLKSVDNYLLNLEEENIIGSVIRSSPEKRKKKLFVDIGK